MPRDLAIYGSLDGQHSFRGRASVAVKPVPDVLLLHADGSREPGLTTGELHGFLEGIQHARRIQPELFSCQQQTFA